MSQNAGAGSPVFFRCSACRSTLHPRGHGEGFNVTLTGRVRPTRHRRYRARGVRSTGVDREYRCNDCGHVGWSNHIDLAERAFREGKR